MSRRCSSLRPQRSAIAKNVRKFGALRRRRLAGSNRERSTLVDGLTRVSRRLTNLIQDIMDFSKLRNNEIQLDKRNVSLHAIVNANMEIFHHYVADKPIRLELRLPDDLPLVYADENRVSQIFYNL